MDVDASMALFLAVFFSSVFFFSLLLFSLFSHFFDRQLPHFSHSLHIQCQFTPMQLASSCWWVWTIKKLNDTRRDAAICGSSHSLLQTNSSGCGGGGNDGDDERPAVRSAAFLQLTLQSKKPLAYLCRLSFLARLTAPPPLLPSPFLFSPTSPPLLIFARDPGGITRAAFKILFLTVSTCGPFLWALFTCITVSAPGTRTNLATHWRQHDTCMRILLSSLKLLSGHLSRPCPTLAPLAVLLDTVTELFNQRTTVGQVYSMNRSSRKIKFLRPENHSPTRSSPTSGWLVHWRLYNSNTCGHMVIKTWTNLSVSRGSVTLANSSLISGLKILQRSQPDCETAHPFDPKSQAKQVFSDWVQLRLYVCSQ